MFFIILQLAFILLVSRELNLCNLIFFKCGKSFFL
jgi:hypothetical protein